MPSVRDLAALAAGLDLAAFTVAAGPIVLVQHPTPESQASGRHAALHWDGTRGVITELCSINGTFINRQKIWTKAVLVSGDQLRIGLSTFDYLLAADFHARFKGAWPAPTPAPCPRRALPTLPRARALAH